MNKDLYVGNLAFHTTDDDLTQAFSPYGSVVQAYVITNPETGESRGFGHIEMTEGGEQAVAGLNGSLYQGRSLTVHKTKPREDHFSSDGENDKSIPGMPDYRFPGWPSLIVEDPPSAEGAWGSINDDNPATRDADAYTASQDGDDNDRADRD